MDNGVLFATLHQWVRANYPGWQALAVSIELSAGGQKQKAKLPLPLPMVDPPVPAVSDPPPALSPPPEDPEVSHSDDFRTVRVHDAIYRFTPTQAAVVRCLWEHHDRGTPEVSQALLLELDDADRETRQLRDLFRSHGQMNPAWGTLIVPGDVRGTYRLDLG